MQTWASILRVVKWKIGLINNLKHPRQKYLLTVKGVGVYNSLERGV